MERAKVTYFPILVEYTDNKEQVVCNTEKEIENGRGFKVLETNYVDPKHFVHEMNEK